MRNQFYFFILTFTLLNYESLFGQGLSHEWIYKYYYGSTGNVVDGVPDQFGGYYLVGYYLEPSCFANEVVLCKVSSSGNQTWAQHYVADTGCENENVYNLNYVGTELYLAGRRQSGWLFKLDSSGTIIWQVNAGGSYGALQYHNGNRLSVLGPPGTIVSHYDTSGAFQWSQPLSTLFNPNGYAQLITADTAINVFCLIQDTASGESMGIGLYTLDMNGNLIFDTIINHHNNADPDIPVAMCKNINQDIFLLSADITSSGAFISKLHPGQSTTAYQSYLTPFTCTPKNLIVDTVHDFVYADVRHSSGFHIVKFDDQLNILDTIKMDTSSAVEVIAVSPNGFLYAAYRPNGIDKALFVNCYDETGICIATYSLLDTAYSLYPNSIHFDSLNNVFVSGDARDGSGGDWGYVLKLNSTVGIEEYSGENVSLAAYPNPANDNITISTGGNSSIKCLRLFNSIGVLVWESKPNSTSTTVQLNSYPSGLYFIEITTMDDILQTKKVLINH